VGGQVVRVYCTALFSYESEVTFYATVHLHGRELLNKRFTGTGGVGMNWAARGKSYDRSLEEALGSAVQQFVSDLKQLPLS
jgi:hypothetical protein